MSLDRKYSTVKGAENAAKDREELISQTSGALFKLGFNYYLPKKIIDNYIENKGETIYLINKEVIDIHASPVSIQGGNQAKTSFDRKINDINTSDKRTSIAKELQDGL